MSNDDEHPFRLSPRQIKISEWIQHLMTPIVETYLCEKAALVDALDFILSGLSNCEDSELSTYLSSQYPADEWIDTDDGMVGVCICRSCAVRFGAVSPKNRKIVWHRGICPYCEEEANVSYTGDWEWIDMRYLEEDK